VALLDSDRMPSLRGALALHEHRGRVRAESERAYQAPARAGVLGKTVSALQFGAGGRSDGGVVSLTWSPAKKA
jgi:hypothetical protein